MGFWNDFKSFAMKGNVIDLAVGVIIGGAFGKIVSAMVEDVVMPLVAMVTGKGQKFTDLFLVLRPGKEGETYQSLEQAKTAGANVFAYGHFIQTIVDFLIIAFFIFLAIRFMSRLKKEEEAKPAPKATASEKLLEEIRDLLKQQNSGKL
jgi:large conductance mechanosensitive channel protein